MWVSGALKYDLRSFQLEFRMMSISSHLARHNPKRVLALKLATHCGNATATKEYRAQQQYVILNAEMELQQIPNMEELQWGKGSEMGKLIKKPGKY